MPELLSPDCFDVLDVVRLDFKLRSVGGAVLPPYLGSSLRGAFGFAFKQAACLLDSEICLRRCRSPDCCGYEYLFETSLPPGVTASGRPADLPHPYLFVVPEPTAGNRPLILRSGDEIAFSIVLFGEATDFEREVVRAVGVMARMGLGADRNLFVPVGKPISTFGKTDLGALVRDRLRNTTAGDRVTVRFTTPTRIRYGKHFQSRIDFPLLVRNIARRLNELTAAHGRAPLGLDVDSLTRRAESAGEIVSDTQRWHDWERYSNRQHSKMKLGGVLGETTFEGSEIAEFLPLLAAGEFVHIGLATSFGLGLIALK